MFVIFQISIYLTCTSNTATVVLLPESQCYQLPKVSHHIYTGPFNLLTMLIFSFKTAEVKGNTLKCKWNGFFIAEFERAAKIRKIAAYRFSISLLVPGL